MICFKDWLRLQESPTSISGGAGTGGAGEAPMDRGLQSGLAFSKPVIEPYESERGKKIARLFGKMIKRKEN